MSFALWMVAPPFQESDLSPGEKIYRVGDAFVVTDDPARATQAEVDAVRNAPSAPAPLTADALAAVLIAKGTLASADISSIEVLKKA